MTFYHVNKVSCLGDKSKLKGAMAELCSKILSKAAPTLKIKASVVGHTVKPENQEENTEREVQAWYKKAAGMIRKDLEVAYYKVRCSSRDNKTVAWEVHHRYSDFCELYEALTDLGYNLEGTLPRQHLFRASADPEVCGFV